MKWLVLSLILLTGCSNPLLSAGKALLSDTPSVTAQVGKENTQQVVAYQQRAERDIVTTKDTVKADNIEAITIQETPFWIIAILILGWLLPSPSEIGRWVRGVFKR